MNSKIRIKIGPIEVEYEGSESFLKEELPDLLTTVSDLYTKSNLSGVRIPGGAEEPSADAPSLAPPGVQGTTGTLAAKLQVKSGPELLLAGAARLTFVSGKETFSRQQIIDEMKSASAYYKKSYLNNLSKYLNSLIKDGKLLEPSQGMYALSAASKTDLGNRIA